MLNNSIKDLKKQSILLTDGKTSIDGRTVHLNSYVLEPHAWGYSIKKDRIAYITPHNELYLVPYNPFVENTLIHNGYTKKVFYFPFCDGDYPVFA